jgi:gliding motility-associated protein GldM
MAGGKETPRQRMIGILYLVLLGLIALNVPDSLLDAFKNITNSLDKSRSNVTTSINDTYNAFEKTKLKDQHERALPFWNKAHEASTISGELDAYIEELKKELIKEGGGINKEIDDVEARDNLDISPRVMIEDKKADVLRKKIDETREKLLGLLGPDQKGVNFSLNTADPVTKPGTPNKTWQEAYFGDGIPLGATLTTLAKIQADNKNAESEVVKRILGKVDQAEINLDQFKAVVVAPTSYILAGQPYTADVFLTAYDSKSNPTITVNGSGVGVKEGVGHFSSTFGEGPHEFKATVTVRKADGSFKTYISDPQKLMVARPSAVVSADKMNVFYIGVPNPVSVSAPGVPKESIHVSMDGGEISGSGSQYVVNVKSIGTAKVTITGEKGMVLGTTTFRTKRIPPPKAVFAGKSSGSIAAANIKAQDRIFAKLDGFDFDAKFSITHFTLVVAKPRQDVITKTGSGNVLSADMHSVLNTVSPGTTVVFRDITAVGPDGVQQEIDAIVFQAN